MDCFDKISLNYIHNFFEYWAISTPNAIAVSYNGESLSYSALNKKANQLAHYLILRNVTANDRIGICLNRSLNLIVTILAVLKTGAAYVPLDPKIPVSRLEVILNNAQLKLILINSDIKKIGFSISNALNINDFEDAINKQPSLNFEISSGDFQNSLCYIIYTSGTTGVPNGVCVTHANIINLIRSAKLIYDFDSNDVWTLFHSYAFDFSVWEIWGALAFGGKLVIVPYEESRDPNKFLQLLRKEKVSILNQTPSAFYQLVYLIEKNSDLEFPALRKIIFGGEALNAINLNSWIMKYGDEKPTLWNMYGITETTVHVTCYRVTKEDLLHARKIIGKPIPYYEICLLDQNENLVKDGEEGEICVLGNGVTSGYFNNTSLTQSRFKEVALERRLKKIYKSGDLAYRQADGNICYIGRIDHQVKIRGYRIELDEIEVQLKRLPEVSMAVVLVKKSNSLEQKFIIAYVKLSENAKNASAKALKNNLKAFLPDYMLPIAIYFLNEFPITNNGKIDRERLLNYQFKTQGEHDNEK